MDDRARRAREAGVGSQSAEFLVPSGTTSVLAEMKVRVLAGLQGPARLSLSLDRHTPECYAGGGVLASSACTTLWTGAPLERDETWTATWTWNGAAIVGITVTGS